MYEERRDNITIKDILLQILLIILFVLLLVWLFPSKGYIKRLFSHDVKTGETEKIEASADDIDRLAVLYNQIFANNIYAMKEAAIGYYTEERLPQTVGDMDKLTLDDMYNKHLVLKLTDKNGNYCDVQKSYVSITKYDNEYQMKVNLSCSEEEDYIIVYLGCYDYCDASGVCEKQVSVKPNSNSNHNYSNIDNGDDTPTKDKPTEDVPTDDNEKNDDQCSYKEIENVILGYNSMGGNSLNSTNFCIECDEQSITLPTPVRDGYKFMGWYTGTDYSTRIEITSNKSNDLKKISFVRLPNILIDEKNCTKNVTKTAILYAKWEEENKPSEDNPTEDNPSDNTPSEEICEYIKKIGGFWGPFGDWSNWSTEKVEQNDKTVVETEVRHEVTGYKEEKKAVGTKKETYVKGYEDQKVITGYTTEKYISGYTTEKYIKDYVEQKIQTGTKEEKKIVGYKTIKTESTDGGKVIIGYKQEKQKTGYKYEKYIKETIKQKVKVGTEDVKVGTTTKTTTVQVPSGTTKVYVKTDSGTVVPSNTSTKKYEVVGTNMQQSCSACATKTIYTWKEYNIVTVYKTEKRTENVPVYKTVDKYEIKEVPIYGSRKVDVYTTVNVPIYGTSDSTKYTEKKVPVYETVKTPVYETKKVPVYGVKKVPVYSVKKTPVYGTKKVEVYGTKEVTVYENIKVSVYSDVTYYRYRTREYIGGSSETKWSTCEPVDENLIKDGFTLTGNKKSA